MAPKHQRLLLIIVGLLCLAAGIVLVLYNFRSNMVFFYSPTELMALPPSHPALIRIGGLVETGSVRTEADGLSTHFVITDGKNTVPIYFKGLLPALFREGQGMVAKGRLGADRVFIADELLAKHDENYMPKEVVDALKQSGHWQH